MIRGYLDDAFAWVGAQVSVPALSSRSFPISFLIDTGSSRSVLLPEDADVLGIDAASLFPDPRAEAIPGFGGRLRFLSTLAELRFETHGEPPARYRVPIGIVDPSTGTRDLPSVLGTDFLRHVRLRLSMAENIVELEPLDSGLRPAAGPR